MDQRRTIKVSEAVREELAEIVGFELEDPRLGDVDVVNVQVSPDSRHALVKIAVRGDEKAQNQSLIALDHAAGYLRHELASRLRLRQVPELRFEIDKNPGVESRIDFLLRRAKKSQARGEKQP
jgi:ribosome-binding factor A